MRLPQAYDTLVNTGGVAFSRGYRQRLGLARACFGDPRLVVLDEPNASLDYAGERVLFDAIEQMKIANITVVIITHRMGILAATNKIAIMQGGAVTAFGEVGIFGEVFEPAAGRPRKSRCPRNTPLPTCRRSECPVTQAPQLRQPRSSVSSLERRTRVVITAIDEFEPLESSHWCTAPTSASPRADFAGINRAGNLLVTCFVLGLGIWSSLAPLESAAIASGVVEPESSRKTIQHLEGGIIREILVPDGDAVRTGQVLIRLDDTKARAEVQSLQGQLWDAMAREAKLQAEQQGYEQVSFPAGMETVRNENTSAAAVRHRAAKPL